MVLDDMHWADAASLELLDHVVRHPPRARVLLVAARRDRHTPAPLGATIARGTDTGAVRRTVLGPLGERECVERLSPDLDRDDAVRPFKAGEGNPLYLLTLHPRPWRDQGGGRPFASAAARESARGGAVFWAAYLLLLGASVQSSDADGARRAAAMVRPAVTDAAFGPERRLAELTARECEIADLAAEGLTSAPGLIELVRAPR